MKNVAEKLHGSTEYPVPCIRMHNLLQEVVEAFPEAGHDEEINGGDAVEWIVPFVLRVRSLLREVDRS